jgi:pimeloyl-ACP methyl ester carboxylesterase
MSMQTLKNAIYIGSNSRKSLYDVSFPANWNKTMLVFVHGYMGFKDWGAWQFMEDFFVEKEFAFCKFNMSHNGGTIENPIDFPDLNAFAENRYSFELNDTKTIIDLIHKTYKPSRIILIGHSRGGGVSILASQHPKVDAVISLAGISSIEKRFSDKHQLEQWEKEGVRYIQNQRTLQNMPHLYIQYLDFLENKALLDIEKVCRETKKSIYLYHGLNDVSVSIDEGRELAKWLKTELHEIPGTDHVFGAKHPWEESKMPIPLYNVCLSIIDFII